jgi:hypothetical protein
MDLTMKLLADYAAADAGGKLNILGVFNILNVRQFPVKHPLMYLVMKFEPRMGEYGDTRKLRIVLVDEDGTELFQISGDFAVPEIQNGILPELNAVISFRDLEFSNPGRYEFRVFIDKEQKGEAVLTVARIPEQQPEE